LGVFRNKYYRFAIYRTSSAKEPIIFRIEIIFMLFIWTQSSFASVFTECDQNFSNYKHLSLEKKVWEYSASPQILIRQKDVSCSKNLEYAWQGSLDANLFWGILADESQGGVWLEVDPTKEIPKALTPYLKSNKALDSQHWVLFENSKIKKVATLKNRQGGQYLNLSKLKVSLSKSPLRVNRQKVQNFYEICKNKVAGEQDQEAYRCGLEVKTSKEKQTKVFLSRTLNLEFDFRKEFLGQCENLELATQDKLSIRREIKAILELSIKNNIQDYVFRLVNPIEGLSWQMWEFLNFTKFNIDVNQFCKDEAYFKFAEIKHSLGIAEFGFELGKPNFRLIGF
jgi:hypothetical protein